MSTINVSVKLNMIDCGVCGGVYAITATYEDRCQEHGLTWTCPYCKTGWGYQESGHQKEVKQLKAQVERAKAQRAAAEDGRLGPRRGPTTKSTVPTATRAR